eukprot:7012748-Ditylum_brightwellii.AAC.1
MMNVPHIKEADDIKTKYNIWNGAETIKLGCRGMSDVPVLIVLDGERGEEITFLVAEGVNDLMNWPLEDKEE